MKPSSYTIDEETRLVESLRRGEDARCPRCGFELSEQEVDPHAEVSYVRSRVWFVCERCKASVVLDRRRMESERPK